MRKKMHEGNEFEWRRRASCMLNASMNLTSNLPLSKAARDGPAAHECQRGTDQSLCDGPAPIILRAALRCCAKQEGGSGRRQKIGEFTLCNDVNCQFVGTHGKDHRQQMGVAMKKLDMLAPAATSTRRADGIATIEPRRRSWSSCMAVQWDRACEFDFLFEFVHAHGDMEWELAGRPE